MDISFHLSIIILSSINPSSHPSTYHVLSQGAPLDRLISENQHTNLRKLPLIRRIRSHKKSSDQPRKNIQHSISLQVRPPRTKKSSASSSVNTEDDASSCANTSIVNGSRLPQRGRKIKVSDIKAEDVLEARSRQQHQQAESRRDENNSSSASSRLEVSEKLECILVLGYATNFRILKWLGFRFYLLVC